MLPWIFAILVLLNAGLFIWGYQRERSLEPPSIPVPEGRYEIRLLGEPQQEPKRAKEAEETVAPLQATADRAQGAAGSAEERRQVTGKSAPQAPGNGNESADGETGIATEGSVADEKADASD